MVFQVQHQPQTQQLLLSYQYLDPRYRAYMLQPSTSSSGEYFVGWPAGHVSRQQHSHSDAVSHHQSVVVKSSCEAPTRHGASKGYHQTNGVAAAGPGQFSCDGWYFGTCRLHFYLPLYIRTLNNWKLLNISSEIKSCRRL